MISRRAFNFAVSSFFVNTDRSANKIVGEINKLSEEHEKVYTLIVKRAKFFNLQGDAAACGWFRRLGEINHKVGDLFTELAEVLGGK